ncbi:MAG TPA: SDR family NAD(P)-dependent oxidoreductase [Opitutaceae bacterium]|nr:SDR family NAD(P)-dependent oxidoreductase [Opitutaceae bacterium]
MPSLANQVVIVTGASSGIGEAVARRLAREGARLVLSARRADRLEAVARELDPTGARVVAVAGDVTNENDRRKLVGMAVEKFGRIDGLVNNAGYGTRGPIELVPVELIRRNFETNVFSLIALTQLVIPVMRAQPPGPGPGGSRGRIVNIGSVAGRISRPLSSVYDSTKHALEAITDGLRGELKVFGLDVVLIRPGLIMTEFVQSADRASEPVMAGTGPYAPYFENYRRGFDRLRPFIGRGDDIARLVERALTAAHPRTHYSAPAHAKLFLLLKWLLPARAVDYLVRLKK